MVHREGRQSAAQSVLVAHHLERADPGALGDLLQVAVDRGLPPAAGLDDAGLDVLSLLYASQAVGQLAPFLLVAYLTTTLSADITEARERIENLAQTDSSDRPVQRAHVQRGVAARAPACRTRSRRVFAC